MTKAASMMMVIMSE